MRTRQLRHALPHTTTLAFALLLTACATTGPQKKEPLASGPNSIVNLRTGDVLSRTEAAGYLATHRHVYVGERHGSAVHHGVQLQVAKALLAQGQPIAIGVEWLPVETQGDLDEGLAGRITEKVFLDRAKWAKRWGHPYEHYRKILRWAKESRVPVWALNAPSGLSRAVAQHGPSGVPDKLKPYLPPLNTGNAAHEAFFREMMKHAAHGHGKAKKGSKRTKPSPEHGKAKKGGKGQKPPHGHGKRKAPSLARYYLAQLVWDESMSRNLTRHLKSPAAAGRTAVVFAGLGHIDHAHGIPLRARKLLGLDFAIVLPAAAGKAHEFGALIGDKPYPKQRADLLWEAAPAVEVAGRRR